MTRPSPYQGWTYWTRTKPFCCLWKLSSVTSDLSVAPPCLVGLVSPLSLTNPPHGMAVGPHFSIVCSGLSRDTPGYVSLVMGEGIHHPFLLVPLTPYYIVIVSVPICLLPIWVLPLDKNQSDSAVCGHSCLKVSNQWLMRAGSSQEAKALFHELQKSTSLKTRDPPECVSEGSDFQMTWGPTYVDHHSPWRGASWLGRKGVPFCTLSTKLSTPNLPLETPPKLGFGASEHVGREEERWFVPLFESSDLWKVAQCGGKTRWLLLKKEINILLCKISNIYFSQKENSIISPRFTVYLLNDHGQIILAL